MIIIINPTFSRRFIRLRSNLRCLTSDFSWRISLVGLGFWVSHYIFVVCLNYSAARQVFRIREAEHIWHRELGTDL
jgi:hypothetical protein